MELTILVPGGEEAQDGDVASDDGKEPDVEEWVLDGG